jgi:hypothetical protein
MVTKSMCSEYFNASGTIDCVVLRASCLLIQHCVVHRVHGMQNESNSTDKACFHHVGDRLTRLVQTEQAARLPSTITSMPFRYLDSLDLHTSWPLGSLHGLLQLAHTSSSSND